MLCQGRRIADPCVQEESVRILRRLYNAHDRDILAVLHEIFHIFFVICLIPPYLVLAVILVVFRAVDELERDADDIVIGVRSHILRRVYILFVDKLLDHLIQLHGIAKSQRVQQKIADAPA